jgi:hypothetical protein
VGIDEKVVVVEGKGDGWNSRRGLKQMKYNRRRNSG